MKKSSMINLKDKNLRKHFFLLHKVNREYLELRPLHSTEPGEDLGSQFVFDNRDCL